MSTPSTPNPTPQPGPSGHFHPQGTQAYASPDPGPDPRTPRVPGDGGSQGTPRAPGDGGNPGNPGGPGQPHPTANRRRNGLAIGALVVAIVGFIFAVWEGAYLLGWILLPIAFVLALVALFQRGKPKKMAAAALVVSIVGSIAGGIAFMASAARVFDEAVTGGAVTAAPAEPGQAPGGAPAGAGDQGAGDLGSRQNPYPLGTAVANNEWRVTVNSFTPDATKAVLAENQFNDPPAAGHTFALANVTITYLGDTSATAAEVSVAYVTSGGNVINSHDVMVVGPDELGFDELYKDAKVTGNVVLQIPANDQGLLRVTPGLLGKEVFVTIG